MRKAWLVVHHPWPMLLRKGLDVGLFLVLAEQVSVVLS